jgi:hypothetical protein
MASTPHASPSDACALHSNGTLKDASEIIWHFDVDDEAPMSKSMVSTTSSSTAVTTPASTTIHPFFARRSGRTTRPSNHILDPDNTMNLAIGKRKASVSHKLARNASGKSQKNLMVLNDA